MVIVGAVMSMFVCLDSLELKLFEVSVANNCVV